ncbi:MAG: hypothetical protein JXB50_16825 [Spirochaetes bacterium]|nr:hypothetical protein [Spirochaetota bacterium]
MENTNTSILIYENESEIKWSDLNLIRNIINNVLTEKNINNHDIGALVMIVNELLENICKYTHDKKVKLTLTQIKKSHPIILIKIENSVKDYYSKNLIELKKEIKRVNSYNDMDKLMIESVLRSSELSKNESKLGIPLIRKLSKGAKIIINKSKKFNPGILIKIKYKLDQN